MQFMNKYRPSRIYVAGVYLKRVLRWRRNSDPYLSIDSFADFCELNVTPPKFRGSQPNQNEISKAKTIFCDSDKLQDFLNEHHEIVSARVIVAGNTDYEFFRPLKNVPSSVRRIYLQNSYISNNPLYRTIPIGIENFRYGVNGHPRLMKKVTRFNERRKSVLVGPFSPTHSDRLLIMESLANSNVIKVCSRRYSPPHLAKLFQNFQFIAAVRGNGVDTHRLWESLYRGCIPIVRTDDWSHFLVDLKLPIEFIESWTSENLESCVENSVIADFSPKEISSLWMPYWKNLILNDVNN